MDGDANYVQAQDNPTVFVLKRELSEVHLLMDNLSTNPNRSLLAAQTTRPKGLPDDWISRICHMNWPPSPPPADRADDAALLIRAKDYLNTLTAPANGASIAFTLLVTQDDGPAAGPPHAFWSGPRAGGATSIAPTRRSLAGDSYPGLVRTANHFRGWLIAFTIFMIVGLLVTSALSWYAAVGNITLAQRAAAQTVADATNKRVADLETGNKDDAAVAKPPPSAPSAPATGKDAKVRHVCPNTAAPVYGSISAMQACEGQKLAQSRVDAIDATIHGWLPYRTNEPPELAASTIVAILGTAILPVFYGILGAGAAVARSLSAKIKASQLTPRELYLLFQQLMLGTVTGSCISLFVAQPSADHSASPGLIGSVALSSSALAFIAGFGVEQVYAALEMFMRRVFPSPEPGAPTK
jgi:hypothetical protein